ncbi:MAG: succinate dehydrogenase/fumarate reductase iron-sulfur subunit [Bdellovibrionales bacterium]
MKLTLQIWRQDGPGKPGVLKSYSISDISPDMSFLEMLDVLNIQLLKAGERPVEFDSDCREGICGSCGCMINGQAHGPNRGTTTCELYMREFKDGDTLVVEPWRATAFPIVKDLVVDRASFDRIIASGGYISAKTGKHADANAILVSKEASDKAFDAATCIGCGACVAACPNASASLFTSAKIAQLALLPQGQIERTTRVEKMVHQMDAEMFGGCTNIGECEAACPKEISISNIALMKSDYRKATLGKG